MTDDANKKNSEIDSGRHSGSGGTTPAAKPAGRRRRRWPLVVGIVALLVVLLILALPSLLCTGPGVRLLESEINSRISGTVQIGRLSLGWFTPAELSRVTLKDPNGDVVVGDVSVVTHRSLLNLISNWHHLGKIAIDIQTLKLNRDSDNQLNILQALANPHPAAAPAAPAAGVQPGESPASGSSTLPAINTTLTLTLADATFKAPGLQAFHAANTRVVVSVDTLTDKPLTLQLDTQAGLANQAASKVHVLASVNAIAHGKLLPPAQMTGQITAGIEKLNLAAMSPVLRMAGVNVSPSGVLTLALAAKIPSSGAGAVRGNIVVDHAALSGPLLKGDSPRLGTVRVPIDASWQADEYTIKSLGVQTGLGGATLTGHGSIAAIMGVLRHKNVPGKLAILDITAAAPLARLLSALPHVMTLPAGVAFTGGEAKLAAAITLGNAAPGASAAGKLPPLSSSMQIDIQPLDWTQTNGGPNGSAGITGTVAVSTLNKPVQADIHLHVAQGTAKPADFSLVGELTAIRNGGILPLNEMTGNLKLLVANLDMSALDQILPRTSRSIVFHGIVNGQVAIHASRQAGGSGEITGPLTITNCALGGAMLKSDRPQIGTVTLPLSISWQGTRFHIGLVGIQSSNIRMLVSGDATLAQLKAMQNNLPDWGNSGLHVHAFCNLGWLAGNFRHTLGLNKLGLRLHRGTMNLQADLTNSGQASTGGETLTFSALRGTWKKTPFIINPVLLGAQFQRQGAKWNLLKAIMDQASIADGKPESTPQLNILVTGKNDGAYAVSLQAVLADLMQEAAPFASLNGRTVAGTLDVTGSAKNIFSQTIAYQLAVNLNKLAVGLGRGQPTITEPSVAIDSNGSVLMPHGVLAGIKSNFGIQTAEINIPAGKVQLDKTAAGWVVPAMQAGISRIDLPAVMKIARTFSPGLVHDDIGGTIDNSVIAASYKPGVVDVSKLHLAMNHVSFRSTAPDAPKAQFIEPQLTVDLACQAMTGAAMKVRIPTLAIHTSDGAIDIALAKPMSLQTGKPMNISVPAFRITGNLAKFVPLLEALGKLKTGSKLQGQLALHGGVLTFGAATHPDVTLNFSLAGGVKNYQLAIPGNPAQLPPDNISLALSGSLNPSAHTLTCLDNCTIGEHAVSGTGANLIQLNKGSVLAWSPESPENVDASIQYNLGRIQALLGPMLPAGLTMAGTHAMKLHITGALTADQGLREFRKLTIAPTALAFDSIAIDGLTLGPGRIPFEESGGILRLMPSAIPANQGTLNTGGHIDFNLAQPAFILSQPLALVNNVHINEAMGGSLLNFLPLAWGGGGSNGSIQLSGVLNLQLRNANVPLNSAQLKKTGTLTGTVSATHITSNSPLFALIGNSMGPLVSNGSSGMAMKDSGIRPTNFDLKQGKIYYQNLQLLLVSFGMTFSGWVGLDQSLHQDVSISGAGISLPIPLSIDGTTSKPQLHLSAKPLKNIGNDIGNTLKNAPNIINNLHGLFGH
jgi:hypothetical protein